MAVTSEGSPVRSEGSPVRSEGSPLKAEFKDPSVLESKVKTPNDGAGASEGRFVAVPSTSTSGSGGHTVISMSNAGSSEIDNADLQMTQQKHVMLRSQKAKVRQPVSRDDLCECCSSRQEVVRQLSEPRLSPIKERPLKESQEVELQPIHIPSKVESASRPTDLPTVPNLAVHTTRMLEHSSSVPATQTDVGVGQLKKSKSVTFQGDVTNAPGDLIVSAPDITRRGRLDSDRGLSIGGSVAGESTDGSPSPSNSGHRKLSRKWSNFSFRSTFSFRSMGE